MYAFLTLAGYFMSRLPHILFLLPLAAIARAQSTSPAPTAGPALPTAVDVRKQVDEAQYRDALKNLQRILDLKGPPAAAYDRAEMLLLRAECQLQIRQFQAARTSLDAAVKEARGPVPSPDQLAKALALSALVAKSPNMLYTPRNRTGPLAPKPIDILDRVTRPAAFKALFEDSLPDGKARVRNAAIAETLPPILDAARDLATLRAIEKAATDDDAQSKALVADLAKRAIILLGNSVADMNGTVETIATGANLKYGMPVQRVDPVSGQTAMDQISRRRGLLGDEPARLRSIQQACTQVIATCRELPLALDAAETFNAIAGDADAVAKKAARVLSDDYSRPAP
jgi:hypothetical protein